jgi:hypothetical protein
MRNDRQHIEASETRDFSLPSGCILCGGELKVRVTPEGAGSVCPACRWISRPQMQRVDGAVQVSHPAGGIA